MIARSFPPVARSDARLLILGSMPGKASLAANQYYAHPRNLFWPIVIETFSAPAGTSYENRLELLRTRGIALWDVLQQCYRETSLDADIAAASVVVNDFRRFFAAHPHIRRILFNGAKAEQIFRRHVLPQLEAGQHLALICLPSTSPANAGIAGETRKKKWRNALMDVAPD